MQRVKPAAALFCCSLFLLSLAGFSRTVPGRVEGLLSGPLTTPFIRFTPVSSPDAGPAGSALVVHGLNSNKEFMQMLSMSLADGGFETWAIDLPGHGDSPERFSSEASQQAIELALDSLPAGTIVIGHSLGAGLLADLAMSRSLETAILLSPPPIRLAPINIERLLVVSGGFDAPRIDASIPALIEAAGGNGEWRRLPWAAHSTALYNPVHLGMIVEWAGGSRAGVRAAERIVWLGLMVAAALVVPICIIQLHQRSRTNISQFRPIAKTPPTTEIVGRIGSLAISLSVLAFVNPLSWLHIFRADYLVGLLLISGLIMWRGRKIGISRGGVVRSTLAAAYIIATIIVIGSSVMHLVPSGEQWGRFPLLAAASFPLFVHDEQTIRMYQPWWRMWGTFLVTRVLIWAAVMTGVLLLNPDAAFLVLITHLVMVAWIPLWLMSGIVARATGEPGAAALFSAIVQGWVFAALFVTI